MKILPLMPVLLLAGCAVSSVDDLQTLFFGSDCLDVACSPSLLVEVAAPVAGDWALSVDVNGEAVYCAVDAADLDDEDALLCDSSLTTHTYIAPAEEGWSIGVVLDAEVDSAAVAVWLDRELLLEGEHTPAYEATVVSCQTGEACQSGTVTLTPMP